MVWDHVSLNIDIVWQDALWRSTAVFIEEEGAEPIVLQKAGRVPLPGDSGPDEALIAVLRALVASTAQ